MKQEDRKTLIEKLDEYIGLLPSELWEIAYEAVDAIRHKRGILYICDKRKCYQGGCLNPECTHTTDPNHRRELEGSSTVFVEDEFGNLWEKIELTLEQLIDQEISYSDLPVIGRYEPIDEDLSIEL